MKREKDAIELEQEKILSEDKSFLEHWKVEKFNSILSSTKHDKYYKAIINELKNYVTEVSTQAIGLLPAKGSFDFLTKSQSSKDLAAGVALCFLSLAKGIDVLPGVAQIASILESLITSEQKASKKLLANKINSAFFTSEKISYSEFIKIAYFCTLRYWEPINKLTPDGAMQAARMAVNRMKIFIENVALNLYEKKCFLPLSAQLPIAVNLMVGAGEFPSGPGITRSTTLRGKKKGGGHLSTEFKLKQTIDAHSFYDKAGIKIVQKDGLDLYCSPDEKVKAGLNKYLFRTAYPEEIKIFNFSPLSEIPAWYRVESLEHAVQTQSKSILKLKLLSEELIKKLHSTKSISDPEIQIYNSILSEVTIPRDGSFSIKTLSTETIEIKTSTNSTAPTIQTQATIEVVQIPGEESVHKNKKIRIQSPTSTYSTLFSPTATSTPTPSLTPSASSSLCYGCGNIDH